MYNYIFNKPNNIKFDFVLSFKSLSYFLKTIKVSFERYSYKILYEIKLFLSL